MSRYRVLRINGFDPITAGFIAGLNALFSVPPGRIGFMHIIWEYETPEPPNGQSKPPAEDGSSEANARLIAAAPELLAALQALVGWEDAEIKHFGATGPDDWIMDGARAAIAKATTPNGQGKPPTEGGSA